MGFDKWDYRFMEMSHVIAGWTSCFAPGRAIGAVIVKDKRILSTGYNGAPSGLPHCDVVGCLREQLHVPSGHNHELCRAVHAEQNAVVQAARYGISIEGSTVYTTTAPCVLCVKVMLNAGVSCVVYGDSYPDELAQRFLDESDMEVRRVPLSSEQG